MKLKDTNYRLTMAGLFSLIGVLVHAPQIRAGDWQLSATEISMEIIDKEMEFTKKHQEDKLLPNLSVNTSYDFCRNLTCKVSTTSDFNMTDETYESKFTANLLTEELIQATAASPNPEQWQLSHHNHQTPKIGHEEEWQPLETIETIDPPLPNKSKFTANFLADAPIKPNVEFSDREQWQFSQYNNNSSEITNEEEWPEPVDDSQIYWFLLVDQLEYRGNDGEDSFDWDILSWVGGDYERLWIKSEGDVGLESGNGEGEIQLLYGTLIAPFWDLQVGLRYDQLYGDSGRSRGFAVIAVEGLAPYLFEVEASLFISHQGDVSARLKAEYELLLSQRLVLQPLLETNIAAQRVEDFGVGSGINDLELGLRLRYEFNRQFAPYIGINWNRKFGGTAELAREEGESDNQVSGVVGIRLLF
jgi:copper resistance protein B